MRLGILGGDRRQEELARLLREEGYTVTAALPGEDGSWSVSPRALCAAGDAVILPMPVSRDGETLNAPGLILRLSTLAGLCRGKLVLGGMTGPLERSPDWAGVRLLDYGRDEALLRGNGFLTAEGAIALAITAYPGSLYGTDCLVTGFGRIGKPLCLALRGLGARVSLLARRPEDRAAARGMGCEVLAPGERAPFGLIFNTVPAPVVDRPMLECQRPDTLLLELASPPGGIDRSAAEALGLRVLDAPGLPGRFAPLAAAQLIKTAALALLEEQRAQ